MITFKLNDMGIVNPITYKNRKYPTHNRKSLNSCWCIQTVKGILENITYTGTLLQGKYEKINHKVDKIVKTSPDKWVLIENHHEAIIDRLTFDAIQPLLRRDTKVSQKTKEPGLFSGFLKCADCGHNLVKRKPGHANLRDKYHYYTCGTYDTKSKSACTRHTTRSDILEQTVFAVITKQIDLAIDMEAMIDKINHSPQKKESSSKVESLIASQKKEKEKLDNILFDLYPDYKNGLISREQYFVLKTKYEGEIERATQTLSNLYDMLEREKKGVDSTNTFIQQFKQYQNFTKLTREILIHLVDEILVYENGEIEIKMKYSDEFARAIDYIEANRDLITNFKNMTERVVQKVKIGEAI